MAIARQCDVCGKFHTMYNTNENADEPNSLMFLNTDEENNSWQHSRLDFCPECMRAIKDLIKSRRGLN